jgi:hypothetical protein
MHPAGLPYVCGGSRPFFRRFTVTGCKIMKFCGAYSLLRLRNLTLVTERTAVISRFTGHAATLTEWNGLIRPFRCHFRLKRMKEDHPVPQSSKKARFFLE